MVSQSDAPDAEGGDLPGAGPDCLEPDVAAGFVQGWLAGDELARVEVHIDRCIECRRYVSDLAGTSAAYDAGGSVVGAEDSTGLVGGSSPAEPPEPPERLLPVGSSLGRYVIEGVLGAGGMGVVYAAFDPKLDRKVALKMVRSASAARLEARERLWREARVMARLSHPNVVSVYDVDMHEGQLFLAMEYVDGVTLRAWLQRGPRSSREVLDAFVEAGRGLSAAHAVGVVHRDFKPDNVLCDRRGRVCVTDFGLARATLGASAHAGPLSLRGGAAAGSLSARVTRTGVVLGTPGYMAPEQHLGRTADARSDQFSFSVALYEALYQQHPFEGPTWQALTDAKMGGKLREPPARSPVGPKVQRALARGLRADPAERFASIDDLLAELSDKPRSRRVRAVAVAAVALSLGAGGLGSLVRAREAARPTCQGAEQLAAGVWGARQKEATRSAFFRTGKPFAADAFGGVERALDAYTRAWAAARLDACEATHVRGEQSAELLDRRMVCLDERLKEVGALTEVFARADAETVGHAVSASLALSPLSACADKKALLSRARPAHSPAAAAKVEPLGDALRRAKVLTDAGKYRDALALAAEVVPAAEGLGERSLLAEALYRRGLLEGHLGHAKEGEETLRHAVAVADAAGDDEMRARASNSLLFNVGCMQMNAPLVPIVNEQAQAAIARLGGERGLEGLREGNFATALLRQGKAEEALREYEAALPLLERAFGPESREVQALLNGLGHALAACGDFAGALRTLGRAVELGEATLGPRHPEVAVQRNNLGTLFSNQLRFDDAEAQFAQVVEVQEEALGAEAPGLWVYLNNLGETRRQQGHPERALPLLERALKLCEAFGQGYPDLIYPLAALGRTHLELGEREKALECLERAAELRAYPSAALEFARARFDLARALGESARRRGRARALATAARDVYRASAQSPLEKQTLHFIEAWLERHARG